MLSKLFPRKINHSADTKARGKDDMSDAQNISISGDKEGDEGVIKPIKSNIEIPSDSQIFPAGGNKTVLGKVSDSKYNVVYFFVYCSAASECGVYAYDPYMYFTDHTPESLIKVYANAAFAFTPESFVNADITYSQNKYRGGSKDYEDTPVLFFTDNTNEPKKLNVLRGYYESVSDTATIEDFITACPKSPVFPITFTFGANDTPNSEFKNINGFQFAYQSVFKDKNVSAISTYSALAVPPSYVNQGVASSASLEGDNVCNLTIPTNDLSAEVDKVKILARRGPTGPWFEVEELSYSGSSLSYAFDNTTVNTAIPKDDQIKQFDNLPKVAQTQTIEGNRLFYGNYVDGFDDVDAAATIVPEPMPRQLDFLSYNVDVQQSTCLSESFTDPDYSDFYQYTGILIADEGVAGAGQSYTKAINKNTGFVINASDLPVNGFFSQGDTFTLTFSVQPKNNWHIYDVEESYHQHHQLGDKWSNDAQFPLGEATNDHPYWQNKNHSGANFLESQNIGEVPAICEMGVVNSSKNNTDLGSVNENEFRWNYIKDDGSNPTSPTLFGTSAANPLIVKGDPIELSITLEALDGLATRQDVTAAISAVLSQEKVSNDLVVGGDNGFYSDQDRFKVIASPFVAGPVPVGGGVSQTTTPVSYSYDLGLQNGDEFSMTDSIADLIIMAGNNNGNIGPIHGNFIINKATVELGFFTDTTYGMSESFVNPNNESYDGLWTGEGRSGPNTEDQIYDNDWTDTRRVGVYIKKIYDVEVLTCLRAPMANSPWKVFDNDSVLSVDVNDLPEGYAEDNANDPDLLFNDGKVWEAHVGKLLFDDSYDPLTGLGEPFFNGEDSNALSTFTLLDGSGGIGGGPATNASVTAFDLFKVQLDINDQFIYGAGNLGSAPMFGGGLASEGTLTNDLYGPIINNRITNSNFYNGSTNLGSVNLLPLINFLNGDNAGTGVVSFRGFETILDSQPFSIFEDGDGIELIHSAAKTYGISFNLNAESVDKLRSFKAGASHAFGVVYYDHRGRASSVYPIGSSFSPPYYDRPTDRYGRVRMKITLTHSAPSWAESFQIVYAGNTSIVDFTQYTTGGAFFVNGEDDTEDGNIYVSLNYLQSNNDVSYTEAFGARSPEGARDMYTFKEGDTLRVISYYTNDENRIFVDDKKLFEVAGQRTLGAGQDNPLYDPQFDSNVTHPSKQGNFIILKNNPNADGFAYEDVRAGQNQPNAQTHNWNKRCVVEIVSPTDAQAEENLAYYETSNVFAVSDHSTQIVLDDGDVWWRRVPVNIAKFNFIFESLIGNYVSEGGNGSSPNFEPYYLETKAFNDTVRNSDVTGKGKVKIVQPNTAEIRRSASLTYSDKTNPASNILKLTSFNPAKLQFKDLPVEHGNINYILPQQDSIFVIHANKCASVPVDRNIITTASDSQSLVAGSKVLGTERYYAGSFGCDNNPESVCVVGNNVYFASKSKKEVYKFNPSQGVEVISDKGMKNFFRKLFKDAMDQEASGAGLVKVVGGYDPAKDEFILSVYNSSLVEGTAISSASTVTPLTNALEEQLYQFIKGTLDVQQAGENVFQASNLPANLKNFYDNYTSIGYDLDASYLLDNNNDGLFTFSDVTSFSQVALGLQDGANAAKERIESNVLATIFAAIDTDTEEGSAAHAAGTAEAIAQYINGLEVTVESQKQTINDLQVQVYGGEGFSIENPSSGSLQGQLNTALDQVNSLTGQLGDFTELNLSAEDIAQKLAKLAAFESALSDATGETTLSALQGVISDLNAYSSTGSVIDFKNALNTQQALSSLEVDLSAVGVFAGALTEISAATQQGQISSDLRLADLDSWDTVVASLVTSGYSGNVSGFISLLNNVTSYGLIDGGIGADTVPQHISRINTKLGYYGDLASAGFNPETTTVSDFLASLDLTPDVNPLQADLDAFTSVGAGTPEEYLSYVNQGSIGQISQAFTDLSNYLAIGDFTTHEEAQSALQTSYDGWQTWSFMETQGYTTDQVTSILADYGVFNTLGFTITDAGIWGTGTPSSAYSNALTDVTTAEGLTQAEIEAAATLASNNLALLNTLSTTLGVTGQTYDNVAAGLTYLNGVDFELGGGDTQAATDLLALQTDMANILSLLSSRGWSPIASSGGVSFGESDVAGMTDTTLDTIEPAIKAALDILDEWSSNFTEFGLGFSALGGGDGYYIGNTEQSASPNTFERMSGLDVNALNGLRKGIQAIHNISWAAYPNAIGPLSEYIPTDIINLFQGGSNTLIQYAAQKGISPNELADLRDALVIAQDAENSPWNGDGAGWRGAFADNGDGEIGSADLLDFLILYGQKNFVAGSISSNEDDPLDTKFFIET